MLTSTVPVAGIVVALAAAAASVTATDLTAAVLAPHYTPLHLGLLFLPELAGALLTAVALGVVLKQRELHYLPLVGMAFLAAGIAVFRIQVPPTQALTLIGSGLTGIGLGAAVAPALFVAGFSLPAASLQRVFAIVELLRAVAAFMVAPVFAHFAATVGGNPTAGTGIALWIGLGIAISGAVAAVLLYALGGARPQTPDLARFMDGEGPAWYSPPLLAAVRGAPTPSRARRGAGAVMTTEPTTLGAGPVVFAYDGSDLAKLAIDEAGRQLAPGTGRARPHRLAPVRCRVRARRRTSNSTRRRSPTSSEAAEQTAAEGASLAQAAGFNARSAAAEAAPTWKGIVKVADEHDSSLIVLGSHGRTGLAGVLIGSVAEAVAAHSRRSVLIIHRLDHDGGHLMAQPA